jgi:hypothetical protein
VLKDPAAVICRTCWMSLENFHEFHSTVSTNYEEIAGEELAPKDDLEEESEMISDFIVYEEEVDKDEMNHIKVEVLEEVEYTETEWIEDGKIIEIGLDEPIKEENLKSINPRVSKQPPAVLDSADDERIRRTANMFCDVCQDALESLREAKAHYKAAHSMDGYITCCDRKFRQRCRLVEHVNTHYNFTYTCEICAKAFDSKSYLAKHQALHDGNKQFVSSNICRQINVSKTFFFRNALTARKLFRESSKCGTIC